MPLLSACDMNMLNIHLLGSLSGVCRYVRLADVQLRRRLGDKVLPATEVSAKRELKHRIAWLVL